MFGWLDFIFGEKAEARQLNRDAAAVVRSAKLGFRTEMQRDASLLTGSTLAEAHARSGDDPAEYKPVISHFKMMHREARMAHNQVRLTAYTLIIIYLRAEQLGDMAAPARAEIDQFIEEWAHAAESESTMGA